MQSYRLDTEGLARNVRSHALEMVHRARASHIGSALSIVDILAVLYGNILHVDPSNPKSPDRDRFILSKGHACVALYATLAELKFFPRAMLQTYGRDHSKLMNHVSHHVRGIEFSTGSLGHGLSFGVGKALAANYRNARWKTFVLLSDGELGEGSNWEAMLFAAHHKLDNLIAILDYNNLQSLTTVDKTLGIEPLADKLKSFGWSVKDVNGHSHSCLTETLSEIPWEKDKPTFVIARTIKGKGVSFMENKVEWHYKSPSDTELTEALAEIRNA